MKEVIITISAVEMKDTKAGPLYTLKDQEGKKYKFFAHNQSGDSVAYQGWTGYKLKTGDTVAIVVKEEQREFQGREYTDRMILKFIGRREPQKAHEQTDRPVVSDAVKGIQIGIQGLVQADRVAGKTWAEIEVDIRSGVYRNLLKQITLSAELYMTGEKAAQAAPPAPPAPAPASEQANPYAEYPEDQGVSVEDIPF